MVRYSRTYCIMIIEKYEALETNPFENILLFVLKINLAMV